jgi:hypothetical protein
VNLFCLGSEQIDSLWDEFSAHVYRLENLERLGHLSADDLKEELKLSKKQLWGIQEDGRVIGIAITRIGGRTCEIFAAAGTQTQRGQIQALYTEIEKWARAEGCVRMRIIGRRGWMRMLKGYQPTRDVILEKELDDGS